MGSALLLGPGLAVAQTMHRLDGMAPTDALVYAQETLGSADAMGRRALELPAARDIVVATRRAIDGGDGLYIRIDLGGAQFNGPPEVVVYTAPDPNNDGARTSALCGDTNCPLSSGGANSSFAVFELGGTGVRVTAGGLVGVRIPDGPASTTPPTGDDLLLTVTSGMVTATIAAYGDPDDALDEVGAEARLRGREGLLVSQAALPQRSRRPIPSSHPSTTGSGGFSLTRTTTIPIRQANKGSVGWASKRTPMQLMKAVFLALPPVHR